jgi:hypothetical protein
MSLLKKIGLVSLNIVSLWLRQGSLMVPRSAEAASSVLDVFQEVLGAVATVEQVGAAAGMDGPTKFKGLIPLVGQVIGRTVLVQTHGIKDQALYTKAMEGFGQASVDLLNSLDSKQVKTRSLAS